MKETIKAIIFDMDNTLIDRRKAFLRLCDYLIETYGTDYPYEVTKEELIEYMIEIDADGYGGLQNVIPKLSKIWKLPHSVEEFIEERNKIFGQLTVLYPETLEVLETLKKKYKIGMITNGYSSVQREKINTVNIGHYFEDIIVSGEEEFEKPDSRIFLKACKNLGVNAEEAVYVGDYYPNDIIGALGANLKPIWITEDPDEHPEYQGIRVNRLREILNYL
ncbi:MAG: family hydrolase [Herbinix sp.]|jgi:putative hydrolase of the HAD superfamily|nr:family hydrolase [Herbinix sp.]